MSTTTKTVPVPRHTLHGQPTSVDRLTELTGVARRTMVRRLLLLGPEEAVAFGPVRDPADRRVATQTLPRCCYGHETQRCPVAELARLAGCNGNTMRRRLDRGATPEDAVAAGSRRQSGCAPQFEWQGQPITGAELARMAGCRPNTMYFRLGRGLTPAEAVALGAASSSRPRRAS